MNDKMGMISSGITLVSVILFALFMLIGMSSAAYAICILLACGYVVMAASFSTYAGKEVEAAKLAGMAFAAIYAVFVILVYYAQITTLRQSDLSDELAHLIDYQKFGLFFNYNLLGYGMLSVSTFFVGLTIDPHHKAERLLRILLLLHGIFTIVIVIPVLGLFEVGMAGGEVIGIGVLVLWCVYFAPVCYLSFRYFKRRRDAGVATIDSD